MLIAQAQLEMAKLCNLIMDYFNKPLVFASATYQYCIVPLGRNQIYRPILLHYGLNNVYEMYKRHSRRY